MLAVRANERSAAAAGIIVSRTKLVPFAIAAFIAGIGGSLMAYQQTVVVPTSYVAIAGIGMFAVSYLAGITCVSGGVLAGIMGAAESSSCSSIAWWTSASTTTSSPGSSW